MVSTSGLVQYVYSTTHVVFPFAKPTWNVANTCESFDGLPPLLNHTPGKFKVLRKNARIEAVANTKKANASAFGCLTALMTESNLIVNRRSLW
jgi:hypothetical protein